MFLYNKRMDNVMNKKFLIPIIVISILVITAVLLCIFLPKKDAGTVETPPKPYYSDTIFFNGLSDEIISERECDNARYSQVEDRVFETHYLEVEDYPLLPIEDGRLDVRVFRTEDKQKYINEMLYVYYNDFDESADIANAYIGYIEEILSDFNNPEIDYYKCTLEETVKIDAITPEVIDEIRKVDNDCIEVRIFEEGADWTCFAIFRPIENGICSYMITYERTLDL